MTKLTRSFTAALVAAITLNLSPLALAQSRLPRPAAAPKAVTSAPAVPAPAPAAAQAPVSAPAPKAAAPAAPDRSKEKVDLKIHLFPQAARLAELRAKEAQLLDLMAGAQTVKGSVDARVGRLSGTAKQAVIPIVPLPGTTIDAYEAQLGQITPELDELEQAFALHMRDTLRCGQAENVPTFEAMKESLGLLRNQLTNYGSRLTEERAKPKPDASLIDDYERWIGEVEEEIALLESKLDEATEPADGSRQTTLDAWFCGDPHKGFDQAIANEAWDNSHSPDIEGVSARAEATYKKANPKPTKAGEIAGWEQNRNFAAAQAETAANRNYRGEATHKVCEVAVEESSPWNYILPEDRILNASACIYGLQAGRLAELGLTPKGGVTVVTTTTSGGGISLPQGFSFGGRFLSLFGGEGDGAYTAMGPQILARYAFGPLVPELHVGLTWARSRLDRAENKSGFKARPAISLTAPIYLASWFALFAETGWVDYGATIGGGVRWQALPWLNANVGYVRGFGLNGSDDNKRLGRSLPGELDPNMFALSLSAHTN